LELKTYFSGKNAMNNIYDKIAEYRRVLPNFLIAFTFAKNKQYFHEVYHKNQEDVLQEIALCLLLEPEICKALNQKLGRAIYYLWKGTRPVIEPITSPSNKKKYNKKPKKESVCDLCGQSKLEYMRKSLLPGMSICGACYTSIRRQDKKRNR
jgi:hypothetical protein